MAMLDNCRHLTNNEIRLMTLQRIINRDPLGQGIPPSFVSIYNTWPPERQREMLEDCQGALCRALFNKNAADGFWHAVGIQVKQGKGGGVSAYPEIAAGFQLWIDPKVRLAIVRKHM